MLIRVSVKCRVQTTTVASQSRKGHEERREERARDAQANKAHTSSGRPEAPGRRPRGRHVTRPPRSGPAPPPANARALALPNSFAKASAHSAFTSVVRAINGRVSVPLFARVIYTHLENCPKIFFIHLTLKYCQS